MESFVSKRDILLEFKRNFWVSEFRRLGLRTEIKRVHWSRRHFMVRLKLQGRERIVLIWERF